MMVRIVMFLADKHIARTTNPAPHQTNSVLSVLSEDVILQWMLICCGLWHAPEGET